MNDYFKQAYLLAPYLSKPVFGYDFAMAELKMAQPKKTTVTREGGESKKYTRYAIRFDASQYGVGGAFVDHVHTDGGFKREGTVNNAVLFTTADDAARAVARRNSAFGHDHLYSIVPVTVTETDAKYEVRTTVVAPTVERKQVAPASTTRSL
ncbi:MAG: hypothetical protein K0S14_1418 [Thermomicrobiales bacterium]|jgi:hypothetical protein|nr:hypothetical protein [Thermomicrobiales bacterium]